MVLILSYDRPFIGQLSVDPNQGGAFGLNIVQITDNVVRFAAVDDNANTITIWKLNALSIRLSSGQGSIPRKISCKRALKS